MASLRAVRPNGIIRPLNMVPVAQWQSATLWMWMLWVQAPSGTPEPPQHGEVFVCVVAPPSVAGLSHRGMLWVQAPHRPVRDQAPLSIRPRFEGVLLSCDMITFHFFFKKVPMFGLFKKREEVFHSLIEQQAEITFEGLKILEKHLAAPNPELAEQLSQREKEADEVRRILIDELNRTFVTPFDREDIFALSRSIDDVLDYANTTVSEMVILEVSPTQFMQRIASLLKDAAYEILQAVQRLRKHPAVAIDHAQRAKALENRVEAVYREAIADLFNSADDIEHVVEMLKKREVYRHLSNAADRGDEAANVISDIVVKKT